MTKLILTLHCLVQWHVIHSLSLILHVHIVLELIIDAKTAQIFGRNMVNRGILGTSIS